MAMLFENINQHLQKQKICKPEAAAMAKEILLRVVEDKTVQEEELVHHIIVLQEKQVLQK